MITHYYPKGTVNYLPTSAFDNKNKSGKGLYDKYIKRQATNSEPVPLITNQDIIDTMDIHNINKVKVSSNRYENLDRYALRLQPYLRIFDKPQVYEDTAAETEDKGDDEEDYEEEEFDEEY